MNALPLTRHVRTGASEGGDLLDRAAEHIFHAGPADVGAQLCLENMKYGLAKIHVVQARLGLTPNATFITSPDVTVTINSFRWNSGFGYGGKLAWGDGDDRLMFLDTKPNCCGMVVGGLERVPRKEDVLERALRMKRESCEIDGVKIKWNLEKGNHFVDVFRVEPLVPDVQLSPYAFMAHTSGSELKRESVLGPGLYVDASRTLREMTEVIETPFGPANVLTGPSAERYMRFYRRAEQFAQTRRLKAAEILFGEFTPLANANHQGLLNQNEIALGINTWSADAEGSLFPLALQGDLPAYLFRPRPNFTRETIERLGWTERAEELGVLHRLLHANLLPHGAGYNFPQFTRVLKIHTVSGRRCVEVKSRRGEGSEILMDLRNVPFEYRDEEVYHRTLDLGLGQPAAKLTPLYVLKI